MRSEASHGLDGKAATADVWKWIVAEEHQVRVTLVDPKGDFCFAVRIVLASWRDHRPPLDRLTVRRTHLHKGAKDQAWVITLYAPCSEMRQLGDNHARRGLD
jgi:hypothetical protein